MGDLATQIELFFNDIKTLMQVIAPIVAFLGIVGLGLMYMGSSLPLISDWKRNNPQAASQVVMGLFFVLIASTVASFISFT
jgi:type IV secretory pathway VirB2 component (pilin)